METEEISEKKGKQDEKIIFMLVYINVAFHHGA